MIKYEDSEFSRIVSPILDINKFNETKDIVHHGITRYEHSVRVAYYSYKITKLLKLDYKETTEAALLHDFFTNEVENKNSIQKLTHHPNVAIENSMEYFDLSDKQIDIIKTHMFPVTFVPPKYLESWIVDIVDDVASIYERGSTISKELKAAFTFLFLVFVNFIKFH